MSKVLPTFEAVVTARIIVNAESAEQAEEMIDDMLSEIATDHSIETIH